MAKIVGFGECVLDFSSQQVEEDGTTTFRACPGGSVANLCVATARLGQESAFVRQVGADPFGHALQKCLRQYGVHTDGMLFSDSYGTLLAFATRQADSDVSYHFGNMPSADKFVRYSDLPLALFQEADLVHVSSCAMAEGETQITEAKLLRTLRQWNKIVSYDVNYRAMQYKSMEEARRVTQIPLGYADIVKATEEELALVTGRRGAAGIEALLLGGASVVLITRGSDGSSWHIPGASGDVPVPRVRAVDPVGAGDCYLGAFLSRVADTEDIHTISAEAVRSAAEFASRAAAICVTRRGAMAGMPTLQEVENASL